MINDYPNTFAAVEYQVNDSPYTMPWGTARSTFINISDGIPWFAHDALYDAWPISSYVSKFLARRAVSTDVTISVGSENIGGNTFEISARVGIEAGGTGKTMRIYIVQVLDHWDALPSAVRVYARNSFQAAAATTDITLSPGECAVVTKTITLNADSAAKLSNVKFIAWAQEPQSSGGPSDRAEVFQAAKDLYPFTPLEYPLGDMNGSFDVDIEDVEAFVTALIDPDSFESPCGGLDPNEIGDFDGDGDLDGNDIQGFVTLLIE